MPLTVEAIDAEWMTRALRQHLPSVTVVDAAVEDVLPGTSTKVRVRLHARGAGSETLPQTVIVKGGFQDHSPMMGPMYAIEARFYAEIAPLIPMPRPHCYFAGSDPASYQSIVVMEDLRRPDVTFLDALHPQGFEPIARRLQSMAGYHAATWESPHFAPGERWADITSRFEGFGHVYMQRYLLPEVWDSYMALPRGAAVSSRFHDRDWMVRALATINAIQHAQPRCLIHGDTHLGNLYVLADGTPGFFDAQVARTAWHHEVSYHITCAADLADRGVWERDLLHIYLDALAAAGGPRVDREEAWLNYRQSLVWGLFIFLINQTQFQTEAINTAYAARFGAAALDHDLRALLP